MADYIDKSILCQAYVHVELPENITHDELDSIKEHLKQFTDARAKFFVYPDVIVEVEFREGSLKTYLTIAGAIYIAMGNYGGFREGVDYLHTDIKRLADSLVSETLFMTRARHHSIRRTEARTGVIGSLKVLMDDLMTLESSIGQISVDETARRVKRLKEDAERLLENVRDGNDRDKIETEIECFVDILPDNCPHPKEKVPDDAAILLYHDVIAEIRKRFGKRAKIR